MLTCCPGEDTSQQARFVWFSDSDSCLLFCAKTTDQANDHTVIPYDRQDQPVMFSDKDDDDFEYYCYHARIDDLEPNTEYVYWVESGGEVSERQRFRTSAQKIKWDFLWMGGIHPEDQPDSFDGIDMVLFTGNGVDCGAHYEDWLQWSGKPAIANCMFAAVPGDAEYSDEDDDVCSYNWFRIMRNNPQNGPDGTNQEACYWFVRGGVLFVGIDSIIHKGWAMDMWDEEEEVLAAQTNWFDRVVTSQSG